MSEPRGNLAALQRLPGFRPVMSDPRQNLAALQRLPGSACY
ncbi:hypothetical protein [Paenibacillus faecis]|nr:hypothetical protein [Paenibacillus faecis]